MDLNKLTPKQRKKLAMINYRLNGIKVGDKIRILEDRAYDALVKAGDIGFIALIANNEFHFKVKGDVIGRLWLGFFEGIGRLFELVIED